MLQHKGTSDVTELKVRSANGPDKSAHLQQLHDEIDKLALLVNEAKRQSDRIRRRPTLWEMTYSLTSETECSPPPTTNAHASERPTASPNVLPRSG